MSCSAAPSAPATASASTCSGRSSPAASGASPHACIRRRRRQRYAENQDSARQRASESAFPLAIKLKKSLHRRDPSCWDELSEKHIYDKIIRLPFASHTITIYMTHGILVR
jgi:hypothetical protein